MDAPSTRNKDLLFRAIELMQCLLSPGQNKPLTSDLFSEYAISEFIHDLDTCEKEEEGILASNARAIFEITIRRKMPTLWLVKKRHPVFATYAALCNSINKSIATASVFLTDTDFPKITTFAENLIKSPLQIIGIEENTSLSNALENLLPPLKQPRSVLCNWRFDAWDSAVAEAYETDQSGCLLRPE